MADYEWVIAPGGYILINDLDRGNMSVTNDAERVLEDIAEYVERRFGLSLPNHFRGYRIYYRDSMGEWDEIRVDDMDHVRFLVGPRDNSIENLWMVCQVRTAGERWKH